MDTLNSSNDFLVVCIKRLGLIVIVSAFLHAVTYNFFQLTFIYFAVFYITCAAISVIIYPHKTGGHYSILIYALFGLGLGFVRTSDLIGYTGSRMLGFLSMFAIGLLITLLTLALDFLLNRGTIIKRLVDKG